ncbi:MAG: MFS transporter [Caulobacteraceae bacterium]|nr:MFS transporter [Caulobacteraceae bacterium]
MTTADDARPTQPVGTGFIAGYTVAQIGAYIAFVPLFQVLLPLQAAAIDPAHKAEVFSRIALLGALVAGAANLFAGAVSDRTASRFGRRRPWLLAGGLGVLGAYALIHAAHTAGLLLAGVLLFQLTFNFLFAALLALVADRVPDRQKGLVSALMGLGLPMGNIVGTVLIGGLLHDGAARFLVLGAIVAAAIIPFTLRLTDPPLAVEAVPRRRLGEVIASLWVDPRRYPDFALAWTGRVLVITAFSLVQGYMLFYLQDAVGYERLFPGQRAEQGLALLTTVSTVVNLASGLAFGLASDRLGRRKVFTSLGALTLGAAMLGLAIAPAWPAVIAAYVLYGLGAGCYNAIDIALITQVLPSVRTAGKDLGIVNLSNALPQVIAPALGVWFLRAAHADFRSLFLVAAAAGAAGALVILPIRGVR